MFFFNWEFTRLCHALALDIKKKNPKAKFSGVMVQKKELKPLLEQKDISYDMLVLQDLFNKYKDQPLDSALLEKYEKEYGTPSLWEMVYADRDIALPFAINTYTHDEIRRMILVLIRGFEEFIEKNNPEFVLFDCIASLPAFALYAVAKKKGVVPVAFTYSRVEDRVYFMGNPYDMPEEVHEAFERIKKTGKRPQKAEQEAQQFLSRFRGEGVKPKYIQNMSVSEKKVFSLTNHVMRFFQYWAEYYIEGHEQDYTYRGKTPLRRTVEKASFFARRKLTYETYFEEPVAGESFAFFPLHLDPELATMVQAPPYVDQLNLIRLIARSLPINMKLYVKEHPLMYSRGWRDPQFYSQIKKIPNVRFIHPRIGAKEIIQKAQLVFTITGTAGFEALLYKKPMIAFGECVYTKMESVLRARDLMQLPQLIHHALTNYKTDEEELLDFLVALYDKSIPVNLALLMGYVYPNITYRQILDEPDFRVLADYMYDNVFLRRGKS